MQNKIKIKIKKLEEALVIDTLIQYGDHQRDKQGFPQTVSGVEEKMQQAMIRFTVPKGGFRLDPQLGSLFYRLGQVKEEIRQEAALEYAREALLGLQGIQVRSALCRREEDRILLDLWLEDDQAKKRLLRLGITAY